MLDGWFDFFFESFREVALKNACVCGERERRVKRGEKEKEGGATPALGAACRLKKGSCLLVEECRQFV